MKHLKIYLKQIFILIILVACFWNEVYSQKTDSIKKIKPGIYVGFGVGPTQTTIKNLGTQSIAKLISNPQNSFLGNVEIGYLFSKYLGISSGINYVSFKSNFTLVDFQNSFTTVDSENDVVEMRITGSGLKEVQSVDILTIPLCINLQIPLGEKVGIFFKGGITIGFPLNQTYAASGTFTYKGFYPAYNDLLENLPAYGFPTDKTIAQSGQMNLKTAGVNPIVSAGLDFFICKKMQVALGINYCNTNLKVKDGAPTLEQFHLTPDADHLNSFSGGSSKITTQSMGAVIAFKYFLK